MVNIFASSTVRGFKSAVMWLYEEQKATLDKSVERELNLLVKGDKNVLLTKEMDPYEGKVCSFFVFFSRNKKTFFFVGK